MSSTKVQQCKYCGQPGELTSKCTRCDFRYCDHSCKVKHFPVHKTNCEGIIFAQRLARGVPIKY